MDRNAIAVLVEFAPKVISLVKGIKNLFGKGKSGKEKAQIVQDAILNPDNGLISLAEGLTQKDLVNDSSARRLAAEATELGYVIMKAEERLKAIAAEFRHLKGSQQPL